MIIEFMLIFLNFNKLSMQEQAVIIDYINWEGKRALRRILPQKIFFGSTNWHKKPQWLLKATDLDKGAERDFALKDILKWEQA
jgi:predicted DNA-binding transcriptional regulator YafY